MTFKAIITGTTGMVGKGVLLECLESNHVESILIVNRKSIEITHPKLKEVIVKDFFDVSQHVNELKGYDACFFCLGISVLGLTEETYHKITYELTLNFARILIELNPAMIFNYVSGTGTDSTEKGGAMWARIKGKTENALRQMPFKKSYMFRPGIIQPKKGIRSKTGWYNAIYVLLYPFFPVLKLLFPSNITSTTEVGRAMIKSITQGFDKPCLENSDINELAAK